MSLSGTRLWLTGRQIATLVLVLVALSNACSYVEIPVSSEGSSFVIARTMELASMFNNWEVTSYGQNASSALVPRGGYGFISIDGTLKDDILPNFRIPTDGMNEAGLTISVHTLHESRYQQSGRVDVGQIPFYAVAPQLFRQANSVPEALAVLNRSLVVDAPQVAQALGGGIHWAIADSAGRSVVVEYLGGVMHVWNNTVRVMTNDPAFSWHLTNLNSFVNLRSGWPSQHPGMLHATAVGPVPHSVGHGWNLAGLPGDSSPVARFARLFYLREYATGAKRVQSDIEGMELATGLINNVHLIRGTVARPPASLGYEFTPYAVLKLPKSRQFLFRGYTDLQWRQIKLDEIDFQVGSSIVRVPVPSGLSVQDVTTQFMPNVV